jgi:hypothetical protein
MCGVSLLIAGMAITSAILVSRYVGVGNDRRPLQDRFFVVVKSGAVSIAWIESTSSFRLTPAPPESLFVWRAVTPPEVLWALPPDAIDFWDQGRVSIDMRIVRFSSMTTFGLVAMKRVDFVLWPFAAALLLLGTFLIFRGRRARRLASVSRCRHCEYSLAGLAPEAPCPECGRPWTPPAAPAPPEPAPSLPQ